MKTTEFRNWLEAALREAMFRRAYWVAMEQRNLAAAYSIRIRTLRRMIGQLPKEKTR